MDKKDIQAFLKKNQIEVTSVFVPFSKSRNANEKHPSLNWRVTLLYRNKEVLTTDYSAGIAHCPAYKQEKIKGGYLTEAIELECERGKRVCLQNSLAMGYDFACKEPIEPETCDVVWALVLDTDVLNHENFEDWADRLGFNSDSIKDKKIYDACLENGLALNSYLGASLLEELREVFQDY